MIKRFLFAMAGGKEKMSQNLTHDEIAQRDYLRLQVNHNRFIRNAITTVVKLILVSIFLSMFISLFTIYVIYHAPERVIELIICSFIASAGYLIYFIYNLISLLSDHKTISQMESDVLEKDKS